MATKKNASNQMNTFTKKKPYRNFRTDAIYFLFEARKETHEQRKTKIDIDEFRSGTTNITHIGAIPIFYIGTRRPKPYIYRLYG